MAVRVKKYKPKTPGLRGTVLPLYRRLLSRGNAPHRALTSGVKRDVGRNSGGRITVRHKGGGHKRLYRTIDFLQDKFSIPATVESVEYDPNRSSFISLVCYADGERRYIVTPDGVSVGDTLLTAEKAPLKPGNRMMLRNIPVGTAIYNIEMKVRGGAKIARAAGNAATLLGYDASFAHIRMPSHEVRKVPANCFASIGAVGNKEHHLRVVGKAGRSRWMGKRPTVRGSAMNAVDHPYGGGEGKQGRGRRRAVTKWGKPSGKGQKTRKPKRYSNPHIVRKRHMAKRK
ncbi:MAG: 50S ribosomal protein L2 [Candidatus Kaiserbacteria bacterium]|nr:50S ribosomal protein L2 [Candidatus Kaiserbacteria bacterium]